MGNCDSRLFLGGADETTLKYISNSLGKETIRAVSNSRSWSRQNSYSQNFNKTGRELMTEYELSVMPNSNCVLFIRGEHPFYCTKYPLEKHPNYKKSGDANDKYLFYVADQVHTGINRRPIEEKDLYTQLYEECQQADNREAERERRLHMRPLEHTSAKGRPLCQSQSLSESAKEYAREHIPADATMLSEEEVARIMERNMKPEPPKFNNEANTSEIVRNSLSSYMSYWEMDENGYAGTNIDSAPSVRDSNTSKAKKDLRMEHIQQSHHEES